MIAQVALNIPFSFPFDYSIPDDLLKLIRPGVRVLVPLAAGRVLGTVVGVQKKSEFDGKLRDIWATADIEPVFDERLLLFTQWISQYYLCSWGEVLDIAIPGGLKPKIEKRVVVKTELLAKQNLKAVEEQWLLSLGDKKEAAILKSKKNKDYLSFYRRMKKEKTIAFNYTLSKIRRIKSAKSESGSPVILEENFVKLNQEQQAAFQEISNDINAEKFRSFLLHGVTGSGKTEVYLRAVAEVLKQGKSSLVLVPEIALTPQLVGRFQYCFGDGIATLHSGMTERNRSEEWLRIKQEKQSIVIGARSAIFAPVKNLGLIIVDEEHDSSYKQQETPFYNARDAAVKIAKDQNAIVVLGSATPSVESFNNVQQNKYKLLIMSKRANLKPLPSMEVINLKEEKRRKDIFYLSQYLAEELKKNFEEGRQSLIFLNRRGYASFLSCLGCGLPILCENCSIALTWHTSGKKLICHHCDFKQNFAEECPECKGQSFKLEGIGTQRIENDLKNLFPGGRFLRMDRDTIRKKGALTKSVNLINNQEVDFIIGTQLISKGHDFKHIGLVCVILADMSLNIPDFRSSERSFQLFSQVSGRAGRGTEGKDGEGRSLIQSYNPSHYAITAANNHDFLSFWKKEIEIRKFLNNPPFSRQILLKISAAKPERAETTAKELGQILSRTAKSAQFQVLGPKESSAQKINNRFFWQILLKSQNIGPLKRLLHYIFWRQKNWRPQGSVRVSIDVDPYTVM